MLDHISNISSKKRVFNETKLIYLRYDDAECIAYTSRTKFSYIDFISGPLSGPVNAADTFWNNGAVRSHKNTTQYFNHIQGFYKYVHTKKQS